MGKKRTRPPSVTGGQADQMKLQVCVHTTSLYNYYIANGFRTQDSYPVVSERLGIPKVGDLKCHHHPV